MKGHRTITTGYLSALLPILTIVGIEIDPEQAVQIIDKYSQTLGSASVLIAVSVHHFRKEATAEKELENDNIDDSEFDEYEFDMSNQKNGVHTDA